MPKIRGSQLTRRERSTSPNDPPTLKDPPPNHKDPLPKQRYAKGPRIVYVANSTAQPTEDPPRGPLPIPLRPLGPSKCCMNTTLKDPPTQHKEPLPKRRYAEGPKILNVANTTDRPTEDPPRRPLPPTPSLIGP